VTNPDGQLVLLLDFQYSSDLIDENGLALTGQLYILAGTPTPVPEQ
jgi:hypothetical protein